VTEAEIATYRAHLGNPDFAVQSNVMMTAWGRRPPAWADVWPFYLLIDDHRTSATVVRLYGRSWSG